MEVVLKVDLTDEQYKELMEKTTSAVTNSSEFFEAAKDKILSSMADYLKENRDELRKLCGIGHYYSNDTTLSENRRAATAAIELATQDFSEKLKPIIADLYKEILTKCKFEEILEEVLLRTIASGLTEGVQMRLEGMTDLHTMIIAELNGIKSRLSNI